MTPAEEEELKLFEILEERINARNNLLDFTAYTHPRWETGPHHKLICDKLEAVERGDIDRLMIFAPPRHSKSELASRRFPSWYLGKHPDHQIINVAYGDILATDVGADVRDILRDPYYQRLFPGTELRTDALAAGRWRTNKGGIYVAAGVGGPVVGRGAHLAIIDDPIKGREEADSQRMRQVAWNWYFGNLLTRLMPGGAIVLMMTRWHEEDLAGGLLKVEGDQWDVLHLPAIAGEDTEHEKALWPDWYPIETLRRIRESMAAGGRLREWGAQYQQRPTAEEGDYIRREWLENRYDERPANLRFYIASDYAATEAKGSVGRGPDYTEHGVFGVGEDDHVYPVDWWYGRTKSDEWIDRWLDLVAKWKPQTSFAEAGVIRRSVEPFLEKRMRDREIFTTVEWIPSIADKAARGRSFQARSSMRTWHFPRTPWAERVIDQCVSFPGGTFDDAFDVCSLFGRMVDEAHPAIAVHKEKRPPRDHWADTGTEETWKTV